MNAHRTERSYAFLVGLQFLIALGAGSLIILWFRYNPRSIALHGVYIAQILIIQTFLLFIMARLACHRSGDPEVLWEPRPVVEEAP